MTETIIEWLFWDDAVRVALRRHRHLKREDLWTDPERG